MDYYKKAKLLIFLLLGFFNLISGIDLSSEIILITGGAGFIGSHLAEKVLECNAKVIIVDNLNNYYSSALKRKNLNIILKKKPEAVNVYIEDICDITALEKIFNAEKPTVICHLAAYAGVRYSIANPTLYYKNNVLGTLNIYECARKSNITKIIFASSSSVYGNEKESPFLESFACNSPISPYAVSKKMGEVIAYNYYHTYNINSICLRFFTVYGPRGRPDMAPLQFLKHIHNNLEIVQYGPGASLRDFTYISDVVDGIIAAIKVNLGFEIINIGRGEPVSLSDFIKKIEIVANRKARIKIIAQPQGDVNQTHACISKAERLLGYAPKISLSEGLTRTFKWMIEDCTDS